MHSIQSPLSLFMGYYSGMGMFAVIFDMDGTLIDNMPVSWVVINRILKRDYGFSVPADEIKHYAGTPFASKVVKWKGKYNVDVNLETFFPEYVREELIEFKKNPKTIGGVIPFLKELKKHHVPMAVATSTTPTRARAMLEASNLLSYFSIIVTASDVTNQKPNPEIFLLAAKKLNIAPSKCVVIEDAVFGIQSGINAGMKTVALLNEYLPNAEAKKADLQINSFDDMSFEKLSKLMN